MRLLAIALPKTFRRCENRCVEDALAAYAQRHPNMQTMPSPAVATRQPVILDFVVRDEGAIEDGWRFVFSSKALQIESMSLPLFRVDKYEVATKVGWLRCRRLKNSHHLHCVQVVQIGWLDQGVDTFDIFNLHFESDGVETLAWNGGCVVCIACCDLTAYAVSVAQCATKRFTQYRA